MINMGIPREAVNNKMKIDGLDTKLLDGLITTPQIIPPPPPLNMLLNVKLKKPNNSKLVEPVSDCRIPSLTQLQEQLGKLRKVKLDRGE